MTTEEQFIHENFPVKSPSKWKAGERFIFVNKNLNVALKPEKPVLNDTTDYTNSLFLFESFTRQTDWNGNVTLDLLFDAGGKKIRFETDKNLDQISDSSYNPLITGLIWLPEIEKADSMLKNKSLYILTSDWLSINNEIIPGETRKFIPITITAVIPGNEFASVKILFKDDSGKEFAILTTLSGTLNSASRFTFPKIFSFSDPKLKYKDITEENWRSITESKLTEGMTQEEVRLSIGKPADINRIPTYSGLREQWQYSSGTIINFQDGKIINFRR